MAKSGNLVMDGAPAVEALTITEPRMNQAMVRIQGTAPLVICRFSAKTEAMLAAAMEEGTRAKNRRTREARDFADDCENAKYIAREGWCGISAAAFRNSFISACKVAGYPMTRAKLSVFVQADGYDREDGTPLVRITNGEPSEYRAHVRNATGVVDIRARPMWAEGWEAEVSVEYDTAQFGAQDMLNLVARAGLQVGVGEGRPDSKSSNGLGFGRWRIIGGVSVGEHH